MIASKPRPTVARAAGVLGGAAAGALLGMLVAFDAPLGLIAVALSPILLNFVIRWPRADAALVLAAVLVWSGVGGRWQLAVQIASLTTLIAMAFYGLISAYRRPDARRIFGAAAMMLAGITYGAVVGLLAKEHRLESIGRDSSGYLAIWSIWTLALLYGRRLRWSPGTYRLMAVVVGIVTTCVLALKWLSVRTGGEGLANYGVIDTAQLPVFLAYFAVVMARRDRHIVGWIVVFAIAVGGLIVTGTRTHVLVLTGLSVLLFTGRIVDWPVRQRAAVVGIPLIIATTIVAVQAPFLAGLQSRIDRVSFTDFSSDESLEIRLATYRELVNRMEDSILVGEGLGSQVHSNDFFGAKAGATFTGDTTLASIMKLGVFGGTLYIGGIAGMWVLTHRRLDVDGQSLLLALTIFYVVVSPLRPVLDDPSLGLSVALLLSMLPARHSRAPVRGTA